MFKVSVENVRLFLHPNADSLELVVFGEDGENQYVVEKGLYTEGDKAVAVPKGALLTHPILLREWEKYLQGADKNIVGFVVLRGQESQGIVIREDILKLLGYDISDFKVGEDIGELLGITKYIPSIPEELKDSVEVYAGTLSTHIEHDCKYPSVYIDKFVEGEPVTITSKIHGSQINIIKVPGERICISSKGLWEKGLVFKEDANTIYDKAWLGMFEVTDTSINTVKMLIELISTITNTNVFDEELHIIGEVVPAIKGFSYGHEKPVIYIYSVYVNGKPIDLIKLRGKPFINVVPELYRGLFNKETTLLWAEMAALQAFCPIDGKTLNEGVVMSNGKHFIKLKNPKFMKKHGTNEAN